MAHEQEGVHDDRKAICRRDGNQLQDGIELAGSGASARGRKKNLAHRILGDSKHSTTDGTSEARAETRSKKEEWKESEASQVDPLALPYVMMSELRFLPACSGVYFAIEESGQVAYIGQSINIR